MNTFQQNLYSDLMNLVSTTETFYYTDSFINETIYRTFSYRLASYTEFLKPGALECRGHMFRINSGGEMEALVSMPFEKFFNLGENPLVMDLDLSQVDFIHDKRDGSLISTYMHEGAVRLKSKTALASDQALGAMRVLNSDPEYYSMVESYANSGHTVIFEYTAPDNRIVLPYQIPELKILGIRSNDTGEYKNYTKLYHMYPQWMVDDHTSMIGDSPEAFIADIPNMKGIEGFVIGLASGQRIKIKTNEYLSLHRAKDSVYSNKRLFEVCLNEASDDLRTLFHDDPYVLNRITEMENIVAPAYNHMVSCVEAYYEANKDLSQKDYAIKGQQELERLHFNLAMSKFHGKEVQYKDSMMKNFKLFVKDEELKPE